MRKFLTLVVSVAIIGALAYAYRSPLHALLARLEGVYLPCKNPITYSVESFDTRFGISKDYFLSALADAEAVWEKPFGRELFAHESEGSLEINLVYDYRQQATVTLQKLGLILDDTKASYTALKTAYDARKAAYALDKTAFEAVVAGYKARQDVYAQEVADWNARGGAPKEVYSRLNAEKAALDAEATKLNRLQDILRDEVDTMNALVVVLNRMAASLNLDVAKINAVGETLGDEFEEGNYQSGPAGDQIDIYEFNTRAKLVRILAHELGHALGLGHVDDPKAIMYRLNNSTNGTPTAADLAALTQLCGESV